MAPRLLIVLAACAAPATPLVVNHQVPARVPFDLGMAFAPAHRTGVLATRALARSPLVDTIAPDPDAPTPEMCANANAMTGDGAAVGCDEPGEPRVYDLDGDGVADLALISHRTYLGGGDRVYVRVDRMLVRAFGADADLADERADAGGIALRFERAFEIRTSFTLHYDALAHRWDTPVTTLHAATGAIPTPQPPYRTFTAAASTELHAAPDAAALATLDAPTGGVIVAAAGGWSFVALKPGTKLRALRVALPLDSEEAWVCGWISSAEIR